MKKIISAKKIEIKPMKNFKELHETNTAITKALKQVQETKLLQEVQFPINHRFDKLTISSTGTKAHIDLVTKANEVQALITLPPEMLVSKEVVDLLKQFSKL